MAVPEHPVVLHHKSKEAGIPVAWAAAAGVAEARIQLKNRGKVTITKK